MEGGTIITTLAIMVKAKKVRKEAIMNKKIVEVKVLNSQQPRQPIRITSAINEIKRRETTH